MNQFYCPYLDSETENTRMKITAILLILLTICVGKSYSQTADGLQVYPNPFCDKAIVHLEVAAPDTVTLEIYNAMGQVIEAYFQDEFLSSGTYENEFVGANLPNGVYVVRLRVGSTANTYKVFKDCSASGVGENHQEQELLLYPNPVKEFVVVPFSGQKTITLTDLSGKLVKVTTTNSNLFLMNEVEAGCYILTITDDHGWVLNRSRVLKID